MIPLTDKEYIDTSKVIKVWKSGRYTLIEDSEIGIVRIEDTENEIYNKLYEDDNT